MSGSGSRARELEARQGMKIPLCEMSWLTSRDGKARAIAGFPLQSASSGTGVSDQDGHLPHVQVGLLAAQRVNLVAADATDEYANGNMQQEVVYLRRQVLVVAEYSIAYN